MEQNQLGPQLLFQLGPLAISDTVVTSWILLVLLMAVALWLSRRLQLSPNRSQTAVEGIIGTIEEAIRGVLPEHVTLVLPFIATLWIYLGCANLLGLIPGLHSPTRDLSATAALAIIVFLAVHWFGIRTQGWRRYLRHYLTPSPMLLPFHIISEITRTVALAIRLFGNMMSLEMAAVLLLMVAGLIAPIPILMLHIIEALVQAYIFGMLALIYVASGIQTQQLRQQRE